MADSAAAGIETAGGQSRRQELTAAIGIVLAALLLRLLFISKQPLWADELFTVYWSQLDPGFLLGRGAQIETNPPVYFLLMHAWMRLFGTSELAVRLPSTLFSVASVFLTYSLCLRLFERRTALLAGALAALEPTAIYYAQEARAYAFLGCSETLALWALAQYGYATAGVGRRPWAWIAVFAFAAVVSVSVHYTAVAFVAACAAIVGIHLLTTRPFPLREFVAWSVAGVLVLLACLKLLLIARGVLATSSHISWIGPMTRWTVRDFFLQQISATITPGDRVTLLLGAPIALIVAAALPRLRLNRVQLGLLVGVPLIFCLIVIGVSLSRPILLPRIGIALTVPLCVLLARCIVVQPAPWRRLSAGVICAALFGGALAHYYWRYHKEDWRGAAQLAAGRTECSGALVSNEVFVLGLPYNRPQLATRPLYLLATAPAVDSDPGYVLLTKTLPPHALAVDDFGHFVAQHPHTMVVLRSGYQQVLEHATGATLRTDLPGGLSVACF